MTIAAHRARARLSAFVYGNITVLGAVVALSPTSVASGQACVVVLATAVTTFVAHIVADRVAVRSTSQGDHESKESVRAEIRDATPIATSGSLPVGLLLLGALGVVPATTALIVAAFVPILRLAATGPVVRRLSGRRSSGGLWAGIGLAVAGATVAVVKALLTH